MEFQSPLVSLSTRLFHGTARIEWLHRRGGLGGRLLDVGLAARLSNVLDRLGDASFPDRFHHGPERGYGTHVGGHMSLLWVAAPRAHTSMAASRGHKKYTSAA